MEPTSSATSNEASTASKPVGAIVAWSVIAALQIALVFSVAFVADDAAPRDGLYEYGNAIGNGLVYVVLLGLTVWVASLAGNVREHLGLRSFQGKWVGISLGIVIGVAIVAYVLSRVFGLDAGAEQGILPEEWRPERAGALAANAAVIVLAAPLVEELFFRGVGVRLLQVFGTAAAILVTGVAFGLAHGLLIGLIPLTLFGIGLAWVRLRAASVWPCVIAHALYNGSVLALGLACLANPECRTNLGCLA